jgi:hypothetical protein
MLDINKILLKYGFQLTEEKFNKYYFLKYKNYDIILYDPIIRVKKDEISLKDVILDLAASLVETIRNTRHYKGIPRMFKILDQIIKDFNLNKRMTALVDGLREE